MCCECCWVSSSSSSSSLHAHVSGIDHDGKPLDLIGASIEGIPEYVRRILDGRSSSNKRNHDRTDHGVIVPGGTGWELESGTIEVVGGSVGGTGSIDQRRPDLKPYDLIG